MAKFCVDISGMDDASLAFYGYRLDEQNEEFKVYKDKHYDDHIVSRARPPLFVEDVNGAVYMAARVVIALPDDL